MARSYLGLFVVGSGLNMNRFNFGFVSTMLQLILHNENNFELRTKRNKILIMKGENFLIEDKKIEHEFLDKMFK